MASFGITLMVTAPRSHADRHMKKTSSQLIVVSSAQ
jgi:hypothetical protein